MAMMKNKMKYTPIVVAMGMLLGALALVLWAQTGSHSGARAYEQTQPTIVTVADTHGKDAHGKDASADVKVDFSKEVLPILSNKCLLCHGPDQDSKKAKAAGFRLDDRDEAIAFDAIVPGDTDSSLVMQVITATKKNRVMPPPDSGKTPLTPAQIDTLRRWIDQGAEYADHWAFVKPTKPQLPQVKDKTWPRNAIDTYVLAKLEESGLSPNKPADKRRLIRRVYLDLIGLPPTPEQTDAFVNDTSPSAYEKVVDALLASPRFGEHWARQWLDKARYADSKGFAEDRPRTMWRYRDWVIDAYNRDLPFDQFTRDQIAGDLLPSPTMDQLIATGFHRNTMTNDEGGTDNEEFRVAAVIDRTNTTMEVWMGITMGCAQCHTHKYDPIYHKEYYQFFAFFNQSQDTDRYNDAPYIKAPTKMQKAGLDAVNKQLDPIRAKLGADRVKEIDQRQALKHDRRKKKEYDQLQKTKPLQLSDDEKTYVKLSEQKQRLEQQAPTALVMRGLPADQQRETYLFKGGSFLSPDKEGGVLKPGVPKAFHDFPKEAPNNRLGLAKWLTDEDNPLTARVQANRIWEQIWGIGLVGTTEDFGFQGAFPSNKDLLDYLAYTYQHDLKWSTKSLIRLIVTSATYRQSGLVTPEKKEIDLNNRLMSRGPRLRLTAEQVRDQALSIAGILNGKQIGGPSVTPYLPDGLLPASFGGAVQRESKGEDLYRRGVYTLWRRTAPYASFAAFDAPPRDTCTVKRSRTNTPLQALVTLNDPVYVEAAQMLGRRLITEACDDIDARLKLGMRYALQRVPAPAELNALRAVYTESLADYRDHPEQALKMAVGPSPALPDGMDAADAAAMTLVGNVLLNLDELINKP